MPVAAAAKINYWAFFLKSVTFCFQKASGAATAKNVNLGFISIFTAETKTRYPHVSNLVKIFIAFSHRDNELEKELKNA